MTPLHFIHNKGDAVSNSKMDLKIVGSNNVIQMINRSEKKDRLMLPNNNNAIPEQRRFPALQNPTMTPAINHSTIYESRGGYQIPFSNVSPQIANHSHTRENIRPLSVNVLGNANQNTPPQNTSYLRDQIDVPSQSPSFSNTYGPVSVGNVMVPPRSINFSDDNAVIKGFGFIPDDNSHQTGANEADAGNFLDEEYVQKGDDNLYQSAGVEDENAGYFFDEENANKGDEKGESKTDDSDILAIGNAVTPPDTVQKPKRRGRQPKPRFVDPYPNNFDDPFYYNVSKEEKDAIKNWKKTLKTIEPEEYVRKRIPPLPPRNKNEKEEEEGDY
jgi:hypothetical protein